MDSRADTPSSAVPVTSLSGQQNAYASGTSPSSNSAFVLCFDDKSFFPAGSAVELPVPCSIT